MYGACVIAFMYGTCVIALMYRACVRTWGRGTSRVSVLRYACTRTCLRAYITRSRQAHIRNALWYRAAHGRGLANTTDTVSVFSNSTTIQVVMLSEHISKKNEKNKKNRLVYNCISNKVKATLFIFYLKSRLVHLRFIPSNRTTLKVDNEFISLFGGEPREKKFQMQLDWSLPSYTQQQQRRQKHMKITSE